MRVWNRLKGWVEEEAESASQYQRLVQNATLHAKGAAGLMTDPELSTMLDWQQKRRPNAAWGDRYHAGFSSAIAFLEDSRKARDAAVEAERERQRRELRRTRQIAAVLGTAFLLAVGFGGYALYEQRRALFEQRRATAEQAAREQSDALADAQRKLAETEEQARQQAVALKDEAETAKGEAEAADARAEHEKDLADTMAHKFLAASTEARLAENFQIEKAEQLQQDQDQHKDPAVIARDQKELDASATKSKEMKLDAAQKAADAAAFAAGVHLITPGQFSDSNLFQNAEVLNYSGKDSAHFVTASQCDTVLPGSHQKSQ